MLSNIQKSILVRAIRIRVEQGEDLDAVVNSYTKLTDEERTEIIADAGSFQ